MLSGAREAQTTLVTASTDAASQVKSLAADVERSLSIAGTATAEAITAGAREAQSTLVAASTDAANQIKSLAADIERSLSIAGTSTAEVVTAGAREAQGTWSRPPPRRPTRSNRSAADVQRSLSIAGTATAETITAGARDAQNTLISASADAASQVKSLAADVQRSLSMAGSATAESITPALARPRTRWSRRPPDAANHVKSLAMDVERTLTAVGADTAASILGSARDAQNSFAATSAEAASQIRAISSEIERSLTAVTANTTDNIQTSAQNAQSALVAAANEVSSKVKTTSADIERSVLAASSQFGSTMTGKTDEIVTYVQQQADRLAQMVDSRRGALVEALAAKTTQLTTDMDRATADALKSIETRGQAFSQSMATNGAEVARNITSAGDLATGAVAKSLKDLEQSSRSAIDQSRQVSIAAVTEMQETSKILRTDTVALFERLREGNILLQEVLTGAHDNLNSLERALVTRVADFVSAMNDVTSRNGVATQTLEDQLTVFNAKTQKALEDLGELSTQFETHGRSLVEAAAAVEQSNRNTTSSIAERKATLESLVTTIDLRTTDLDQRLSRFTGLLDELLAAAEERARDIARVVAETAGQGSAAISRQFEAVRTAAENERQQTLDAMSELYQQSTAETDAMFKESTEKFSAMVQAMKQMAVEMHNELEATRNELRRGVLEMPQEAAENTAQMRKVIVDQIEALAELNRIVAHHGRGLDVVSSEPRQRPAPGRAGDGGRRRPHRHAHARCRQRLDTAAAGSRHAEFAPHRGAAGQPGELGRRPRWLAVGFAQPHRCRRWRRPRGPARPSAAAAGVQPAGIAVARHRPADGPQPRRRDVGPLPARRKQGLLQAALYPRRPEGV